MKPLSLLTALLLGGFLSREASAQVVDRVNRGWYFEDGTHAAANTNYICGECGACGMSGVFRNWFLFDLSGITGTITGATLVLSQPSIGYVSPDALEVYVVAAVETPIPSLLDGSGGVSTFEDLGTGVNYGGVILTEADSGTLVSIPLTHSAIVDMNAASGLFAIGGAVASLSPMLDPAEYTFGATGSHHVSRLVLETEPAECFVVIGDGPGSTTFDPGMHAWVTYTDVVQDFYLVTMADIPEFELPSALDPAPLDLDGATSIPGGRRGSRSGRYSAPSPSDASVLAGNAAVPYWMRDGDFTVQIVMWNPDAFPLLPEQVSNGLYVRIRGDGTISAVPYGAGTIAVWHETDSTSGTAVIRFPFQVPGF